MTSHPPTPEQQAAIEAFGTGDDLVIQAGAGTGKTSTLRMLAELARGRKVALVGGGRDIRDLAAAAIALKAGAPCEHPELFAFRTWGEVQDYCLAPGTRVLTRDLRWQPIELIAAGDELVAFDEHKQPGTMGRRFRTTTVEHAETITRPSLKITLSSGLTVTASAEHRWLVYSGHNLRWAPTAALLVGTRLPFLGTWDEDPSRDAGWLAGMFDGEGYVGGAYATSRSRYLSIGQKEGPVLERLRALLKERGFTFVDRARKDGVHQLDIKGGLPDWLRLLGSLRPVRLLPKAHLLYEDIRIERIRDLRVTAIEAVGPQDVVAIRTDHRTFIAEGLFSHNCQMDEGGSDLRAMVKLIDDYGPDALISAIDRLVDEPSDTGSKPMALTTQQPDVVVSTAHKAKGREWASVLIGEDFYPPKKDEDGTPGDPDPGELRLAYVAVTRARLVLDRGSLRWLDTYAPQSPIPGAQRHQDGPEPVTADPAPPNSSSTAQPPAQPLPTGIFCGPHGRIDSADLDDGDKRQVELFAAWLSDRKTVKDEYDPLIAATAPGTAEYSRLADERARKLRQLNDQYERDTNAITAGN